MTQEHVTQPEFDVVLSDETITWHQENLTMPPSIVQQCDAIRNHARVEGVI